MQTPDARRQSNANQDAFAASWRLASDDLSDPKESENGHNRHPRKDPRRDQAGVSPPVRKAPEPFQSRAFRGRAGGGEGAQEPRQGPLGRGMEQGRAAL